MAIRPPNICPEEADKLPEIKMSGLDHKIKRHLNTSHLDIRVAEEEKAIVIIPGETALKSMRSFLCNGTMSIKVYKYLKWVWLICRPSMNSGSSQIDKGLQFTPISN